VPVRVERGHDHDGDGSTVTVNWRVLGTGSPDLVEVAGDRGRARSTLVDAELEGASQEVTRQRFLDLVGTHDDVLDRTCRPGHLTGSAVVVDHTGERLLLLWHNKAGRWLQPGGHADGDGNLAHVAWREATEETGIVGLSVVTPAIHLDIHEFRPPDEDAHLHYDIRFLILAPPGAVARHNHESSGTRWAAADELPELGADPGLMVLAERGLRVARTLSR
jgi:8-oxo-dGTP pyrophosphatase MutT (NUDIX family)